MEKENPASLWSERVWRYAEDIYQKILCSPFIKELAAGNLPREKYLHYLSQDRLYLKEYFRVLAHVASRIHPDEYAADFLRFATDGITVEQSLHSFYLGEKVNDDLQMSPTCALYTSTLKSMAYEPVEVEVAALLPCFVVYQRVGMHIYTSASGMENNPYKAWIETYADEYFEKATARAVEICDSLAARASEEIQNKMTEIFIFCTRMEYFFWDSAWKLEKWEI